MKLQPKFLITINQVQVIVIQLQWKIFQNIATNSFTYKASSFAYLWIYCGFFLYFYSRLSYLLVL